MRSDESKPMNTPTHYQLEKLTGYFVAGAADASKALSIWLGRMVHVSVEPLEIVSLNDATEQLGSPEGSVCACCMGVSGAVSGLLLFGFDDDSGMKLCDAVLSREQSSMKWDELEKSAVMETANIVGCAFLNSLANIFRTSNCLPGTESKTMDKDWIPTPPVFVRDYAAAVMQFALVDQTQELDTALVARTSFTIDDWPVDWRLLLIPDSAALNALADIIP